jgi:SDR family mycofactocin-dependent oxidoreductase
VRLAEEGADIIAVDLEDQVETVPYPMATPEDMAQTVKEVEALDRRIIATRVDVRDFDALKKAVDEGIAELGHLDIVSANAGIAPSGPAVELTETEWQDVININLTGAWHTVKATVPQMVAQGTGGSIILTSSTAGLAPYQNLAHYVAAKHGVVGLMRALALELAPNFIRVNTVNPTTVNTPMVQNDAMYHLFRPDLENPTREDTEEAFTAMNALPIPSDEARYITGVTLPVDAGQLLK